MELEGENKPQLCDLGCGLHLVADPPPRLEAVEAFSRRGLLRTIINLAIRRKNETNLIQHNQKIGEHSDKSASSKLLQKYINDKVILLF